MEKTTRQAKRRAYMKELMRKKRANKSANTKPKTANIVSKSANKKSANIIKTVKGVRLKRKASLGYCFDDWLKENGYIKKGITNQPFNYLFYYYDIDQDYKLKTNNGQNTTSNQTTIRHRWA